ncbi:RNA polymerase sigma-70 factor [Enhygromyxa salina]|uniref:RNA polymerase sigma factor n=1 Tax=Enhygromyxa salina TaxID=215803 RepID=A0A0C1Z752_9BACT|nr:RNA polymerase sigma-70 factor [Enhygromyxa salina]
MSRALAQTWGQVGEVAGVADLDDESLVERANSGGDNAAFAELVRRHQGKVRGLLLRLTGNRTLADDLAQEVFLRAYRGLVGFEGRSRFSTWIYRIAYNVFVNHRTRGKTLSALPEGFENHAPAPDTELSASRLDLRRDLAGAIATLPERYRVVVTLHYLQDVSYPEIAELLELPIGTVKTHLHRAKKLLREHLRDAKDNSDRAEARRAG